VAIIICIGNEMSQLNLSEGKGVSHEEEKGSKGDMFKDKPIQPSP
jgi:pimeloyl-ACP methyl ester carboxylesterase